MSNPGDEEHGIGQRRTKLQGPRGRGRFGIRVKSGHKAISNGKGLGSSGSGRDRKSVV